MATISANVKWADNTDELKRNLLAGTDALVAMQGAVNRTADAMGGTGLLAAANKVTAAIDQLGGVTKLTAAEQDRASATIDKAIEKYTALGLTAPTAMQALSDKLHDLRGDTDSWLSSLTQSVPLVAGFIAAFSVDRLVEFGRQIVDTAARFEDLSRATGLSIDDVQRFAYVAPEFGVDMDTMTRGVEQLSAKLANGDANATRAVEMLGLSVKDLLAEGPKDAFLDIADAVGHIQDPMEKSGVAAQLFGNRLARELIPALGDLRTKINEVPKDAIINDEDVKRAKDLETSLSHAWTFVESMAMKGASAIARGITASGQALAEQAAFESGDLSSLAGAAATAPETTAPKEAATAAATSNATLVSNLLTKLRTDALEPLTAAQQANIASLHEWGVGEAEIAKLVGSNTVAVHQYIDVTLKHAQAVQTDADALAGNSEKNREMVAAIQQTINGLVIGTATYDRVIAAIQKMIAAQDEIPESLQKWYDANKPVLQTTQTMTTAFGSFATLMPDMSNRTEEFANEMAGLARDGDLVGESFVRAVTPLQDMGKHVETNKKAIDDARQSMHSWVDEVGGLANALAFLGRVSDGSFGAIINDIGNAVAAFDNARKSVEAFEAAQTTMGQISAGIGMAGSFMQATRGGQGAAMGAISGAATGGEIGSMFGPIGTAVGAIGGGIVGLVRNLFGPSQQELQGRQTEAQFEQQMGGWQGIQQALLATGMAADQVNAKIQALWASEKSGAAGVQQQIDSINEAINDSTQDQQDLTAAMQRYGLTVADMGQTYKQQQFDAQAQQLINDWRLLVGAGADVATVNTKMASSMNQYLQQAQATGVEVPAAMQPIIEKMIEQGDLTDANGNKITDMSQLGVSWSESMTQGFQKVVDKLDELMQRMGLIPAALDAIPTNKTIDIDVKYNNPAGDGSTYAALGGIVTARGIQYFAAGGNVLAGPWMPRGTDTVPAMLTPGEMVLTPSQQRSLVNGSSGGEVTANIIVNIDGRQVHRSVERIQGRQLQMRRKLPAA